MQPIVALLVIGLLLLFPASLHAQGGEQDDNLLQPARRFRPLTAEDGLAQNGVVSILQDRAGFIWVGTHNGLSHFDGYQFTTYRHLADNPRSLSDNDIRALFEDRLLLTEFVVWKIGKRAMRALTPTSLRSVAPLP
ncbi:MAG: hypothetical protein H0T73_01245, partial [Ardenticatenales bacterium]|nr:hypothetical protein [Ardenticatenales bacterium]